MNESSTSNLARPEHHDAALLAARLRRARIEVNRARADVDRLAGTPIADAPRDADPVTTFGPAIAATAGVATAWLLGSHPLHVVDAVFASLAAGLIVIVNEFHQQSLARESDAFPEIDEAGVRFETPARDTPTWPVLGAAAVGGILAGAAAIPRLATDAPRLQVALAVAALGSLGAVLLGMLTSASRQRWWLRASRASLRHRQRIQRASADARLVSAREHEKRTLESLQEALAWDGLWVGGRLAREPWSPSRGGSDEPVRLHAVATPDDEA